MAESKFLKHQDKNGNYLIDICDEIIEVAEVPCEDSVCIPSATAIVPNWKTRKSLLPFLNEKICHYQVSVETSYTTTIEEKLLEDPNLTEEIADGSLNERFEEHLEEAVVAFLEGYNKDDSEASKVVAREAIIWDITTDYFLEPRTHSRLRLLYSLPYEVLNNFNEAQPEIEDEDAETGPIEVTYTIDDLKTKLIHVRKALKMYGWYNKILTKMDGSNLYYQNGPQAGVIFALDDYGDSGIVNNSIMAKVLPQLDDFLNSKGYNISGVGFGNIMKDKVNKVIFNFSEEYELTKLTIYTEGCSQTPVIFDERLNPLKKESAWSDSTAMAYLAHLDDMITDLTAREPMPWLEFITKHTYPTVYSTINKGYANTDPEDSVGSCIADALIQEGKQLGEDILDEVFSIGDAINYQFHKNLCSEAPDEILEHWAELGIIWDPDAPRPKSPSQDYLATGKVARPLRQMATQQAYETLCADDQSLTALCSQFDYAGALSDADAIWKQLLNDIKFCGMSELLMSAIQCLFGGLSFEQAMATVIESALRASSLENFDKLFVGLPIEKQIELEALAKRKLESGDIFKAGSTLQQTSDALEGKLGLEKLWEDEELVEAQKETWASFQTGGMKTNFMWGDPEADNLSSTDTSRRTLAKQFDGPTLSDTNRASNNVLMEAWIQAYLELFSDNYLELLDYLNKLPGAQIVAYVIATLDCPVPPILNPSALDFIKDREFPYCANTFNITFPKFVNPFEGLPESKDFMKKLYFDTARWVIQKAIYAIIVTIMMKICEVMGSAACNALGASGAALASLADGSRTKIADAIRDSICGDDVDQEKIDDTVVDMLSTMGLGSAALADTEQVLNFAGDISSAVTTEELYDAFLCDPSQEFLSIVRQIIQHEYPSLAAALKNEEAIKSFFCNMGNIMPADFKEQMKNVLESYPDELPQAASLCAVATPEQIEQFCELRGELLGNRATPEQIQQLCTPDVNDLKDLSDIAQGGIPSLPPLVSEPGCENGILPYEPDETIVVASVVLNNMLEQLKIDFTYDMIGNGPFKKKWGFINMVLSDTMGKPLTAHFRKSFNRRAYVDFYMQQGALDDLEESPGTLSLSNIGDALFPDPPLLKRQKGAFPTKIAEWLQDQMSDGIIGGETSTFTSNNEFLPDARSDPPKTLKEAGIEPFIGGINPLKLDEQTLGYNTSFTITGDTITFVEHARKQKPDFTLEFKDNCKGLHAELAIEGEAYSSAFNLEFYLSELVSDDGTISRSRNLGSQPAQPWAVTSISDDHAHTYTVDLDNNGGTSYNGAPGEEGHSHSIRDGIIQVANDHTHILEGVAFSPEFTSLPRDTSRIKITETPNSAANLNTNLASLVPVMREPFNVGVTIQESFIPKNKIDDAIPISDVKYEFLSIDNTLDDINFDNYPKFVQTFRTKQNYLPQIVLLKEMIEQGGTTINDIELQSSYDTIMESLLTTFIEEVANNSDSFEYGAVFDDLSYDDAKYVIANDLSTEDGFAEPYSAGHDYYDVRIDVPLTDPLRLIFKTGQRPILPKDQIMGISWMQHEIEQGLRTEENRIFYLDPLTYGGSYVNPPVYIKPLQNKGWLGFVDVMFPEISPCKPYRTDLIDFEDIQKKMNDAYPTIPEDPRLQDDQECAVEVPYNRILDRAAAAGLEGLVAAAIRIYVSTSFIKSMSTFTKFHPRFPDVFSTSYASYIVEDMKASFKDPAVAIFQGPFKDTEFWLAFLEQAVQLYGRRVDNGDIFEPPESVIEALNRLNDLQEKYEYPDKEELNVARDVGDAGTFESLKNYRESQNYEAIQETEEDAKLIFKELVMEQLSHMGEKFVKNLEIVGMTPDIYDLDYYLLQELSQGGQNLNLSQEIVETYVDIETEGDEHYTNGGAFALSDGSEYVGYYHVVTDEEDGGLLYMAGEFHSDAEHNILTPFANKIKVEIGDVEAYPATIDSTATIKRPFIIEKYIRINGGAPEDPSTAVETIQNAGTAEQNISDIYPGTLELVTDPSGQVVGLTGELGVRYGLRFSVIINDAPYMITEVEVDSLDLKINQVDPFEGDSKLLLCLINLLKEDEKFKLIAHYIFPLSKLTSTIAIYNSEAFLPSIGEKVVPVGNVSSSDVEEKPGMSLTFFEDESYTYGWLRDGDDTPPGHLTDGWAHKVDRDPGLPTPFVLEWDDWDQVLLRSSKTRIKRMFKNYYNSRTWSPGDEDGSFGGPGDTPGVIITKEFKQKFQSASGAHLLPWWKRRMLRTNPFNENGELCENND